MIDIVACTTKKPSPTFCLKNFSVVQKSDAGTVIQHREKGTCKLVSSISNNIICSQWAAKTPNCSHIFE